MSADALTAVILGSSSILAGTFFVNWAVDHRVIWQTATEASVRAAINHYLDLLEGPAWLRLVLTGIATVAVAACLGKLIQGGTSRILFDGGSLFLLSAAIFIHAQHVQSGLAAVSQLSRSIEVLPQSAFGAISQIASAHAIIAVTLTGVVSLQAAQYYSERQIQKEIKKDLQKIASGNTAASVPPSPRAASAPQSKPATPQQATAKTTATPEKNLRRSPRKK